MPDDSTIAQRQNGDGPCARRDPFTCKFDPRTFFGNLESITAYRRYFNYDLQTGDLVSDGDLPFVDRYFDGPCVGTTTFCIFTTRAIFGNLESITAYGRFYNYDTTQPNFPLVSTGDLTDVPRHTIVGGT